jgi:uncharacterized membrane-anchored protein YitT (DUF2179 family)
MEEEKLSAVENLRQAGATFVLMALGSLLIAVAVKGILVPLKFLSGGFTGLALNTHYLFPEVSVGMAYALWNIPVFIAGWF